MVQLEKVIKHALGGNHNSVRKTFLLLDSHNKGYITVQDIFAAVSQHSDLEIDYDDLKKLVMDHDKYFKKGKLNYADFTGWIGGSIQQPEGFYFRHDSRKNPSFDVNQEKLEKNKGMDRELAAKTLMRGSVFKKVVGKFKEQWKSVRKAYCDLDMKKTGQITR